MTNNTPSTFVIITTGMIIEQQVISYIKDAKEFKDNTDPLTVLSFFAGAIVGTLRNLGFPDIAADRAPHLMYELAMYYPFSKEFPYTRDEILAFIQKEASKA